jgi:hypothetical protein
LGKRFEKKTEFNRGRRIEGANGVSCGDAPVKEAALE